MMSGTIFVNLPVQDLARSTRFYQKLGFKKDARFSSDEASCMVWSNEIKFMLLARPFYSYFIDDKTIADTHKTSAALLCLTLDSEKAVTKFVTAARRNGGRAYQVTLPDMPDMTGYEVEDPDGHILEPLYMPTEPPKGELPHLPALAVRSLYEKGITNVEQLKHYTEKDLLRLHGFGPKSIRILKEAGVEFKPD